MNGEFALLGARNADKKDLIEVPDRAGQRAM